MGLNSFLYLKPIVRSQRFSKPIYQMESHHINPINLETLFVRFEICRINVMRLNLIGWFGRCLKKCSLFFEFREIMFSSKNVFYPDFINTERMKNENINILIISVFVFFH